MATEKSVKAKKGEKSKDVKKDKKEKKEKKEKKDKKEKKEKKADKSEKVPKKVTPEVSDSAASTSATSSSSSLGIGNFGPSTISETFSKYDYGNKGFLSRGEAEGLIKDLIPSSTAVDSKFSNTKFNTLNLFGSPSNITNTSSAFHSFGSPNRSNSQIPVVMQNTFGVSRPSSSVLEEFYSNSGISAPSSIPGVYDTNSLALSQAYQSRLSSLSSVAVKLLSKRETLGNSLARVQSRANAISSARAAIEAETLGDCEGILHRLRAAEASKQQILSQQSHALSSEIAAVDQFYSILSSFQVNPPPSQFSSTAISAGESRERSAYDPHVAVEFMRAYPELCAVADQLLARNASLPDVEVSAEDLPRETAVRADVLLKYQNLVDLVAAKDRIILQMLQDREELLRGKLGSASAGVKNTPIHSSVQSHSHDLKSNLVGSTPHHTNPRPSVDTTINNTNTNNGGNGKGGTVVPVSPPSALASQAPRTIAHPVVLSPSRITGNSANSSHLSNEDVLQCTGEVEALTHKLVEATERLAAIQSAIGHGEPPIVSSHALSKRTPIHPLVSSSSSSNVSASPGQRPLLTTQRALQTRLSTEPARFEKPPMSSSSSASAAPLSNSLEGIKEFLSASASRTPARASPSVDETAKQTVQATQAVIAALDSINQSKTSRNGSSFPTPSGSPPSS